MNCYFDAVSQKPFEGTVTRTANTVDPTTHPLLTEVQVPNPQGALLPGMFTRAVFAHLRAEPPVIVPSDSVIARANGLSIAVVQDGMVDILRKLSIGRDYGAQTEVSKRRESGRLGRHQSHGCGAGRREGQDARVEAGPAARPSQPWAKCRRTRPTRRTAEKPAAQQSTEPTTIKSGKERAALQRSVEPGAPGELQGPGPVIHPQPDYGAYDTPGQGQAGQSGKANSGSVGGAKASSTGSSSTSSQPH